MKHTISIHDEISGATFHRVLADIKAAGKRKILLSINSPGGSVTAGAAILASLRAHKPGVEVEILGLAASMASVIATAGRPVKMSANGIWMMHNPSSTSSGTAQELRKDADTLDKFRDTLVSAYVAKSGKPAAEIMVLLDAETWLTAAEAKAAGFVDEVTGPSTATASAWASKYPRLATVRRAAPQTLAAALKAITDPRAKDLFFRKNRIALIREAARLATPALPPAPQTLTDQLAAITDPHTRSKFYKTNRSLLIREAAQAATPGCIHNII